MFKLSLTLVSLFCFNLTFSQVVGQQTKVNVNTSNNSYSVQQRELVTSEPKTEIKVPLEVNLNDYTHLVLVDINSLSGRDKSTYNLYEDRLMSSPLLIINPVKVDKRKFKKNPMFLRNNKNPKYVYFYYTRKQGSGNDDINTTLILRDYNNKILYSSSHYNIGIPDILYPLIGF